jgi:hypothetical protein
MAGPVNLEQNPVRPRSTEVDVLNDLPGTWINSVDINCLFPEANNQCVVPGT